MRKDPNRKKRNPTRLKLSRTTVGTIARWSFIRPNRETWNRRRNCRKPAPKAHILALLFCSTRRLILSDLTNRKNEVHCWRSFLSMLCYRFPLWIWSFAFAPRVSLCSITFSVTACSPELRAFLMLSSISVRTTFRHTFGLSCHLRHNNRFEILRWSIILASINNLQPDHHN